jgi:hypothetical protein
MKVVNVPTGSRGIDCDTTLTASSIASIQAEMSVDYVVRYLSALTSDEVDAILAAGVGLQLINFAHAPGWLPSAELGTQDGEVDIVHLKSLDIPTGMVVWIDLEGSGGGVVNTTDWVNARSLVLSQYGYIPGLYVGDSCILNAAQLYALPNIHRYWKAFNAGIPEVACGYCQFQAFPPNRVIGQVLSDIDFSCLDYKMRSATMLVSD